jgi:hypothetical protein
MELRLRQHDAVGGDSWTLNTPADLIGRLDRCLKQAKSNTRADKNVAAWADVANYCAFIANVLDPTILSSQVLVGVNPNNSQRVALILARIAEVEGFMRDERDQTDPTHGNRIVLELLGLVRGYFGEPGQRSISELEVEVAGLGRLLAEVRARQVIGEARTLQLAKEIEELDENTSSLNEKLQKGIKEVDHRVIETTGHQVVSDHKMDTFGETLREHKAIIHDQISCIQKLHHQWDQMRERYPYPLPLLKEPGPKT